MVRLITINLSEWMNEWANERASERERKGQQANEWLSRRIGAIAFQPTYKYKSRTNKMNQWNQITELFDFNIWNRRRCGWRSTICYCWYWKLLVCLPIWFVCLAHFHYHHHWLIPIEIHFDFPFDARPAPIAQQRKEILIHVNRY